jgi:pimeloyl-ACP methyl ester carboxylesterase
MNKRQSEQSSLRGEVVILLHGILLPARTMEPLARRLREQGYTVCNIDYPSRRHPLEKLASIILPEVQACAEEAGIVHFVGHSMGGLLIRTLLHHHPLQHQGKVVMLGTPNHGSEVADFLKDWKLYRWLYGPAGQQLGTHPVLRENLFGTPDFPLGIIAGTRSIDPLSSWIIGRPSDGKVSVHSTRVAGMTDHITGSFEF